MNVNAHHRMTSQNGRWRPVGVSLSRSGRCRSPKNRERVSLIELLTSSRFLSLQFLSTVCHHQ